MLGLLCVFLALPAAGMTVLAIASFVAGLRGAEGSLVAAFFAALIAGVLAWAMGAVAWRMLRVAWR